MLRQAFVHAHIPFQMHRATHLHASTHTHTLSSAWHSLFQKTAKPFTADHGVLFGVGLHASNVFYSHRETVVWVQPELPPGKGDELQVLKHDQVILYFALG